jgi:hypothetical protein
VQSRGVSTEIKSELGLKRVKFFDMIEVKEMVERSVIIDSITMATLLKYLSCKGKIRWDIRDRE